MIKRIFLLAGLALMFSPVQAAYYWKNTISTTITYPTPVAAGDAYCAHLYTVQGYTISASHVLNAAGTQSTFRCARSTGTSVAGSTATRGGSDDTPPAPCQDKNPQIVKWFYGQATPPYRLPKNLAGCDIVVDEVLVCRKEVIGAFSGTYCMMQVRRTGNNADTSPPGSPKVETTPEDTTVPKVEMPPSTTNDPDGKCPAGSVQGGSDSSGIPICIGTGTNPPATPQPKPSTQSTKTEATPDGGTKTTTTTQYTNADGSTTTNVVVVTKAPDGTTSTSGNTTVGPKPNGAAGVDDKPEDDKYDLCKKNPMLSVCRNSSVAGTCGQITCTGDAIQCATLRAAAIMQCNQQEDIESLKAMPFEKLGESILAMQAQADVDALVKGTEVDVSAPSLDQSGFAPASCLPSRSISMMGQSIAVDFTSVCNSILPLRAVILAVSLIAAYLIVSKSILNS